MSLQRHSFSEITSPSARYLDKSLGYNQVKLNFEQGFALNYMDALSAPNDSKINNYSSTYLTNLVSDKKIFSTTKLEELSSNIITYIAYRDSSGNTKYLNYDDSSGALELLPDLSALKVLQIANPPINSYYVYLSTNSVVLPNVLGLPNVFGSVSGYTFDRVFYTINDNLTITLSGSIPNPYQPATYLFETGAISDTGEGLWHYNINTQNGITDNFTGLSNFVVSELGLTPTMGGTHRTAVVGMSAFPLAGSIGNKSYSQTGHSLLSASSNSGAYITPNSLKPNVIGVDKLGVGENYIVSIQNQLLPTYGNPPKIFTWGSSGNTWQFTASGTLNTLGLPPLTAVWDYTFLNNNILGITYQYGYNETFFDGAGLFTSFFKYSSADKTWNQSLTTIPGNILPYSNPSVGNYLLPIIYNTNRDTSTSAGLLELRLYDYSNNGLTLVQILTAPDSSTSPYWYYSEVYTSTNFLTWNLPKLTGSRTHIYAKKLNEYEYFNALDNESAGKVYSLLDLESNNSVYNNAKINGLSADILQNPINTSTFYTYDGDYKLVRTGLSGQVLSTTVVGPPQIKEILGYTDESRQTPLTLYVKSNQELDVGSAVYSDSGGKNLTDAAKFYFSGYIYILQDGVITLKESYIVPTPGFSSAVFVLSSEQPNTSKLFYQLEIVDDNTCRIKHTEGGSDYYLVYDKSSPFTTNFYFASSYSFSGLPANFNSGYRDGFDYIIDNAGYAYFTKTLSNGTFALAVSGNNLALAPITNTNGIVSVDSLFTLLVTNTTVDDKLNTSWVSYDTTKFNDLSINVDRSCLDIKTNNLLHFEYEGVSDLNTIDVNTLKLKNLYTDKFVSKRGNPVIESDNNLPVPFFREYTNIYTGGNQEAGYSDMVLNYVFYNYDLRFNSGLTTEFTTPSSMFPFTQINVNDTPFIQDGSLGGTIPLLSDKITAKSGINATDAYGSYLTTWLSGGTWVDRYYFPDIITRQNALSGNDLFAPTFENIASVVAYQNRDKVKNIQYFDVISDLVFSPNNTYYYSKIGKQDILNYVNNIPDLSQSDFSNFTNNNDITFTQPTSSLVFNGSNYTSVSVDKINENGSFTLFFTLESPLTGKLPFIIGNLIDTGVGIYNDSAITPILYIKSNNRAVAFNTDGSLLYSLSFDSRVADILVPPSVNSMGNYFITVDNSIFRVATDGTVVGKIDVDSLSGYRGYYVDVDNIYFLKQDQTTFINYNTKTDNYLTGTVLQFASNETEINDIYVYNEEVYGFESSNLKKDTRDYLYGIFDNSIVLRYHLKEFNSESVKFAQSNSHIKDINIDRDDNIYMLHNNYELTKVDSSRKLLGNLSFSNSLTATTIDFINEYKLSNSGIIENAFYPVIISYDEENTLYTIKDFNFTTNTSIITILENISADGQTQRVTGFNGFIDNKDYENLNFKVSLANIYNNTDTDEYVFSYPITNLSKFANTVCVSYSNDGVYSVYINGSKLYSAVVDQYKYIGNVFTKDDIFVGSMPFHNNTVLGDFLGIPSFGKLFGGSMKNFRVYNRGLTDTEIKSLFMNIAPSITDLCTSLPCGQRNNLEEIQSVFKLSQPSNTSNTIDVVVKNTGIDNVVVQSQITTNILATINTILPGDVTVRDVKYINY